MGEIIEQWTQQMIKKGVSKEHIENMKNRTLESESPYCHYYDTVEGINDKTPQLVDVSKIVGINNGWQLGGMTVYELFFSATSEISFIAKQTPKDRKIKENLDSLMKFGIEYQYNFYVDESIEEKLRDGLPRFTYYEEDDIFFCNATHRTISALMFNAPQMVGYVLTKRKNPVKYKNYNLYIEAKERWKHFLTNEFHNFEIKKLDSSFYSSKKYDVLSLVAKDYPEIILMIFDYPIKNVIAYNFQTNQISILNDDVTELISKIRKIDVMYTQKIKGKNQLPLFFVALKKARLNWLYDFLHEMLYYHQTLNIHIGLSTEEIVDRIQRKLTSEIIDKCRS